MMLYQFVSESRRTQGISEQEYVRVTAKALAVLAAIEIVVNSIETDDVKQYLTAKKQISNLHQFYHENDVNDFASGSRSGYALAVRYMDFVLRIAQRDCA
jgi:hypothetical protein